MASEEYKDRDKAIWKVLEEVIEMVKEQPKAGGWIPCSERLPDESGAYMATIQGSRIRYVGAKWFAHTGDDYPNKSKWCDLCKYEEVIAWQPLPKPYKEEKENGRS